MPLQVLPPGSVSAYSNYGYALAGLVIERLSGQRYEDYLAARIFAPLGDGGNYRPPAAELGDAGRCRLEDIDGPATGRIPSHSPTSMRVPSGGVSATAADMGRFMLALLGDGSVDGARILSTESVGRVLTPAGTAPTRTLPGSLTGFTLWRTHGQQLLHKDGTLGDQIGMVMLAPEDKFGIFVASNALPGVANHVLEPLLTHLLGPSSPAPAAAPLPDASSRAARFAGAYRDYVYPRHEMGRILSLMPMIQSRVTVDEDGAIRWRGRRWVQVEPLVFRSDNSLDSLVFRQDASGNIVGLHTWGGAYERISWWEQSAFHLAILGCCADRIPHLRHRARSAPNPPPAGARRGSGRASLGAAGRAAQSRLRGRSPVRVARLWQRHAASVAGPLVAVVAAPEPCNDRAPARARRAGVAAPLVDARRTAAILGARRRRHRLHGVSQLLEAPGPSVLRGAGCFARGQSSKLNRQQVQNPGESRLAISESRDSSVKLKRKRGLSPFYC